jgi:hypothetical protein
MCFRPIWEEGGLGLKVFHLTESGELSGKRPSPTLAYQIGTNCPILNVKQDQVYPIGIAPRPSEHGCVLATGLRA